MKKEQNSSYTKYSGNYHFASFLDALSNPVMLLKEHKVLHINDSAKKLCQLDNDKIDSIKDIFDIEDETNLLTLNRIFKSYSIGPDKNEYEVVFRHPSHKNYLIEGKFKQIKINNQNYGFIEFDEIVQTERTVVDEYNIGADIFDSSSIPVCIIDNELSLLNFNNSFRKLFSIGDFDVVDKFFLLKMTTSQLKKSFQNSFSHLQNMNEDVSEFDAKLVTKNDTSLYINFEILRGSKTYEWIVILKDQTRETELFKKLEKVSAQASNLKSIFVAQMSHEIRTPINAILSFANLIKEEIKDQVPPDIRSGFEVINRGGERIIRTINLILDTSEVMTDSYEYEPKEFNLFTEVFNEVYMKYKKIAKSKGLEFGYVRNTDDLMIIGDEYMVKQILSNIFDNAVKFTNEGSVEANLYKNDNNKITLEIIDSGIGMSQEYIERVYEPFTQEDEGSRRRYEGNGLGLTLTKSYCDINDVDVSITSNKEKGTKVKLVFNKSLNDIPLVDETLTNEERFYIKS